MTASDRKSKSPVNAGQALNSTEPEEAFRTECYRCFRAASVCICNRVPMVENRTGVIVLQHHREVLHPIGTARIARLGLRKSKIEIAHRHNKLGVPETTAAGTALLYPRPDAQDVADLPTDQYPANVIVLDGTWAQASAMYRANSWLHALPHLMIRPTDPSNYRIRKQPKEGCLSTIEALVHVLKLLEPEQPGFDELLRVFDSMVDDQLRFIPDC